MDSAAIVVTRKDGFEVDNAVPIGDLYTPKESGVHPIFGVVSGDGDAAVDTSGVGVPNIHRDLGNRLAGVGIDVLNLKKKIDAI